jgi:hypothetical protein
MKSSQPVQLVTIKMGMDVESSNPQDNRIFEVTWIVNQMAGIPKQTIWPNSWWRLATFLPKDSGL